MKLPEKDAQNWCNMYIAKYVSADFNRTISKNDEWQYWD